MIESPREFIVPEKKNKKSFRTNRLHFYLSAKMSKISGVREDSFSNFEQYVSNKFESASETTDAHALENMASIQIKRLISLRSKQAIFEWCSGHFPKNTSI